jgi:hypothetical protein
MGIFNRNLASGLAIFRQQNYKALLSGAACEE